ncbi:hypothetical protein [Nocardioides sp. Leaf285]|uniref:hypothetical protein n=1 Tax=Nocardioides sp. Leaf285 TaxID=1736322 RepID=UPI0007025984|nr:hypothetical protein [Nocardioides sp. Leaf285]KQP63137.1 hypothetical protein ASF47_19195 [Nocardioides sp. Leaf285]
MSAPFDATAHPRAGDGTFATKAHPETDLGPGGVNLVSDSDTSPEGGSRPHHPSNLLGRCPDCSAPMVGRVDSPATGSSVGTRSERFLPGSTCDECGHEAADMVQTLEPDDEGGRTFEYRLDADGMLRVTDDDGDTVHAVTAFDNEFDDLNVFGVDAIAVRRALEANVNIEVPVHDLCDAAGQWAMTGPYDIIIQRGAVPRSTLLDQSEQDVVSFAEAYFDHPLDNLLAQYPATDKSDKATRRDQWSQVRRACQVAGLPAMIAVYGEVLDRGGHPGSPTSPVTPERVEADYTEHIAPAIDRLEQRLMRHARAEMVDRHQTALDARFGAPGASTLRERLDAAYDAFDNGDQNPTAYAAALDAAASSASTPDAALLRSTADRIRRSAATLPQD